jgi:hypothetical protein
MSDNQAILKKAIQKAIDGGWNNIEGFVPINLGAGDVGLEYADSSAVVLPMAMIFNHDFTKALWGDKHTWKISGVSTDSSSFQITDLPDSAHHLQQMVIAVDPIKYLGENI